MMALRKWGIEVEIRPADPNQPIRRDVWDQRYWTRAGAERAAVSADLRWRRRWVAYPTPPRASFRPVKL
jgi:hypothetical protein